MNKNFTKRLLIAFLLFVFLGPSVQAQVSLSYSIGFTSGIEFNGIQTPAVTDPMLISFSKNCINLNNGVSKFLKSAIDSFSLGCIESVTPIHIQFSSYPNPARSFTIIKLDKVNTLKGELILKLAGLDGVVHLAKNISTPELLAGYRIPVSELSAGTYIISISATDRYAIGNQKILIIK